MQLGDQDYVTKQEMYRSVRKMQVAESLGRMYADASRIMTLLDEEDTDLDITATFDALYPESLPDWRELTHALLGFVVDYERLS